MSAPDRPVEPTDGKAVWYRGWEVDYSFDAFMWTGEGWHAFLGGADQDAPHITARSWSELLDEIDEHSMTDGVA